MIRLGLRLALSDGRQSAVSVVLTALAVALGTAVLLFAASFQPALDYRDSRQAWREALPPGAAQPRLLLAVMDDRFEDQVFVRVLVARLADDAPAPPGVTALPGKREAYVSPALADLLARTPADQLAPRIGKVVGTIGPAGLRSPQELVAVIGCEPGDLQDSYAAPVAAFRTTSLPPNLPPLALLILVLAVVGALVPVAVFVATATRLAAARREQRLAALRLVGATTGQVGTLAVVEALLYTLIGAPLGVALFFVARPWVAFIPLDGATWWPDSIQPPLLQAAALLLTVQMVGAGAALVGMRRLAVSPLGIQQRATPPPPRAVRILPALAGVVVLLVTLATMRGSSPDEFVPLLLLGGSFAAIIGGIAFAGPWLTAVVGRVLGRMARGPSTLLAARRLADDPRGSFGSIAGVIMAVFVASAFFSFMAYVNQEAYGPQMPLARGQVMALFPRLEGMTASGAAAADRIRGLAGVSRALAVRDVLVIGPGDSTYDAWIVECPGLVGPGGVLDIRSERCDGAGVHTWSTAITLQGDLWLPTSGSQPQAGGPPKGINIHLGPGDVQPLVLDAPSNSVGLPDVLIDPSVVGPALDEFPVTQLFVATDGSSAAIERVRAAIQSVAPFAVIEPAGSAVSKVPQFAEVGRIVGIGLIGSLALAGCSLAVATITGLLQRRRQFALLRAAGLPMSRLRALVLIQSGVPLVVASAFSALLGVGVAQAILLLSPARTVPLPDVSLVLVLAGSVFVAMSVVAATLPGVDRLTRPQSIRSE